MNAFAPFLGIFSGWGDILQGKDSWRQKLPGSPGGVAAALLVNLVCVIGIIALSAALAGFAATLDVYLFYIARAGVFICALWLIIVATRLLTRFPVDSITLLVPTIHALSLLFVLQFVMSLFGSQLPFAMYGVFGYMMFRLGRVAAGMSVGIAVAFSAMCVLVLVAVPYALYMLLAAGAGST